MGCNICSGCSSQTQRRFSYINITSYWLVLSVFGCSSFIFILCFLGLSTIISEHLIYLPQGIHPQIFRNGVRFPDNLFSCLNKRRLLLEQMEMDGEHALFVSSSRSCRWHPGTLDSAQVPLLMQPVWSSALLSPLISTASSEVARKSARKAILSWQNCHVLASKPSDFYAQLKTHSVGQLPPSL